MPAIYSNDPNIGIRMMGLDYLIPTPVSSITYKGRAGVDARRRKAYVNAPSKGTEKTFSRIPRQFDKKADPKKVVPSKQDPSIPSWMPHVPSWMRTTMNPTLWAQFGRLPGGAMASVPKPNIPIAGTSMAKIADGIADMQQSQKSAVLPSETFGDPYGYRTLSGGVYNTSSPVESMDPASRSEYEKRLKMRRNSANDIPSSMFSGIRGSMIA